MGQTLSPEVPRQICRRCRRPQRVCVCDRLTRIESQTHVVFIQHPLEARVGISTCRMAHLSLPNSELHVALNAEEIPALVQKLSEPDTALLFPADDATDVEQLTRPPKNLVVVDGTWDNAKKLFQRSPLLKSLPRIGFVPPAPGNYRIRKEPAAHCLSTIEAVAQVLEKLEKAPGKFTPILGAFDRMVDLQLDFIEEKGGPSRYERPRRRNVKGKSPLAKLKACGPNVVITFAEANAWPRDAVPLGFAPGHPELSRRAEADRSASLDWARDERGRVSAPGHPEVIRRAEADRSESLDSARDERGRVSAPGHPELSRRAEADRSASLDLAREERGRVSAPGHPELSRRAEADRSASLDSAGDERGRVSAPGHPELSRRAEADRSASLDSAGDERGRVSAPGHPELSRRAEADRSASLDSARDARGGRGYAELLQLVALRLSTGEKFEALLKPHSALSPAASLHLGVPEKDLLEGEERAAAIDRWKAFVREDDVICTWGRYPIDLLRGEGVAPRHTIDLRAVLAQHLHQRPGAVKDAGDGPRALRRLYALASVARTLLTSG